MGTDNTLATLDGMFKEVYADKIENLVPEASKIQKAVSLSEAEKIGDSYHCPVVVTGSHGVTYASSSDGAFSLNAPIVSTTKDAIVDGYQMLLRDRIAYVAASRAAQGGEKAFKSATAHVVKTMMDSMAKRVELSLLYGGLGIGAVEAAESNVSSTSTTVTVTAASWAAGIWSGLEGAQINFYNSTSLISSGADSIFVVGAVDVANRTVTVTGTATGITALEAALPDAAPGLDIYFLGAYSKEMAGIHKILANTGSLFSVSAATYALWGANTYTVSGQLTQGQIDRGIAQAVGRGLDGDVTVWVNPNTWSDLNIDQSAKRRHGKAGGTDSDGAEAIEYYSQSGLVRIEPHAYVKAGYAYALPMETVSRVGSTDITFKLPGANNDRFFRELDDNAGFELRNYTDQAVFLKKPAACVLFTGFTNAS